MFRDQAAELRQLALRHAAPRYVARAAGVPLVVVSGGKGGVGSTTIAINLATQWALCGHRTLLVDADLAGPDATAMCGLDAADGIREVLSGQRELHEVLLPGPAGMHVLPGAWPNSTHTNLAVRGQAQLMEKLRNQGSHFDVVVIDAGNGLRQDHVRYLYNADQVLLATKPDDVSVMDTYAAIKLQLPVDCPTHVFTVVNRVHGTDEADAVYKRLAYACRRFLGRPIRAAGHVPEDPRVAQAAAAFSPLLLHCPQSKAAAALTQLAQRLATHLMSPQYAQQDVIGQEPASRVSASLPPALCLLPSIHHSPVAP